MNIFIGDKAPFGLHAIVSGNPLTPDGWVQLAQLAALVAIISGVWAVAEWVYVKDKRPFWGWLAYGAAVLFLALGSWRVWP